MITFSPIRIVLTAAFFFFIAQASAQTGASIVISQIYGGGGNSGATLKNDFIELFNRSSGPVSMDGWSLQYASASGTTWDRTLLSGTLQPGQYYLVQEAQGSAGAVSLPTPDAEGVINLGATSGKVALVSNSGALSGSLPSGSQVVDFVGYGSANAGERSPLGVLSNTTAAKRASEGCVDTNNNQADFTIESPLPRNSRSPLNLCTSGLPVAPQITTAGVTNAASYVAGPVAPGEVVTIFGSALGPASLVTLQLAEDGQRILTSLARSRVLFDGVSAPMIYTSAGQVSAVAPYAVGNHSTTDLQVEYEGRLSNRITLPVAPSAPGIFTLDSSGRGQGAVLNQDYRVNGPSAPARKGSVVILYATGGGRTLPDSEDGRVVTEPAAQVLDVSARIGGVDAKVLYAGAAPGLVSGVLQVNARIPDTIAGGTAVPVTITIGSTTSQPAVTLVVEGDGATRDGTGPVIEQKLQQLKREPAVPLLPEIPDDYTTIPPDWLALVSWNIQTGGTSTSAGAARPPMVKTALSNMFSGTYQILAAQEISNADSAGILRGLLPGASGTWESAFFDSSDSMDNGFWHRTGVTIRDAFPLFVTGQMDSAGRLVPDLSRTTHPPAVAHFEIGDIDFTLINVHLTFADGDTTQTANEMRHVLDYLDWYFNQPDHDPDVIVCGDFNIPSALSGQTGRNGMTLDAMFDQDARFQVGERRFVVTIHEPTSRSSSVNGGVPANNYDHCVLSADMMEEFVQARRLTTAILTSHPDDPEQRLTSDHFPVVAFFRTRGEGVALDSSRISVRPPWSDLRSAALQFERRILSVPLAAGPERKKSSGAFRWRALDGRIEP